MGPHTPRGDKPALMFVEYEMNNMKASELNKCVEIETSEQAVVNIILVG